MFGVPITPNSEHPNQTSLMQSPYLSINPSYLSDADEYLLLEDASATRTRVQVMFSAVGTATVCGAALGGLDSLRYTGLKLLSGRGERMQTTSAVLKNGGRIASKFGSVAVLYYTCSIILEKTRGVEDEINTVAGGAAAGALFSLPSVLNVKSVTSNQDVNKFGFVRRPFMRLPPIGRFFACTGLGLLSGALISLYKTQTSHYVREITKRY